MHSYRTLSVRPVRPLAAMDLCTRCSPRRSPGRPCSTLPKARRDSARLRRLGSAGIRKIPDRGSSDRRQNPRGGTRELPVPFANLPSDHYASAWETFQEFKTPEQITEVGIEFFSAPEGAEREALLLQLLQAFHGYTTKYLHMILRGHLPYYAGTINEDARIFLQRFLPKGTEANRNTLLHTCRSLHLAFKGAEAGEVYDILVMCLLKAINKWNPYYTDGVRKVVDVIDTCFPSRKQFTAYQLNTALNGALGFDGTSVVRMLARRGLRAGLAQSEAAPGGFRRPVHEALFMKSLPEVISSLQHAQELLEPSLASLYQQDNSELFLAVAPGIAQEAYDLVQEASRRTMEWGWFAGRRGRISKLLIDVLGCLQQSLHTRYWGEAALQATAAADHLRHALAGFSRIATTPRRRSEK